MRLKFRTFNNLPLGSSPHHLCRDVHSSIKQLLFKVTESQLKSQGIVCAQHFFTSNQIYVYLYIYIEKHWSEAQHGTAACILFIN